MKRKMSWGTTHLSFFFIQTYRIIHIEILYIINIDIGTNIAVCIDL